MRTSQGSGIPMEPGRKRPAASSCHTLLKLSTRLSGSSPTNGITAQLDYGGIKASTYQHKHNNNHNALGCERPSGLDVKQSPNAQDVFQPIPGLISCAGVTGSVGIVHVPPYPITPILPIHPPSLTLLPTVQCTRG